MFGRREKAHFPSGKTECLIKKLKSFALSKSVIQCVCGGRKVDWIWRGKVSAFNFLFQSWMKINQPMARGMRILWLKGPMPIVTNQYKMLISNYTHHLNLIIINILNLFSYWITSGKVIVPPT